MSLIYPETYPVYKRGAPVASEDLNKSNEITAAAIEHLHDETQEMLTEYRAGHFHGATFTPQVVAGKLQWTNNQNLPNPAPFTFSTVVYTPSLDASGNLSWTNGSGLPNPPTINIKGPQGDSTSTIDWSKVTNRPTTLAGYGIANAYNKADLDAYHAGIENQIESLQNQINALNTALGTKMPNARITVSTAAPSGGSDGDIWFKVG